MSFDARQLSDRAEISDLLARYCRGIDRQDEPTLRSIFHEDARFDCGPGLFVGSAHDWVGWALGVQHAFEATHHGLLQTLIELDGDSAEAETYFVAYHRFASAGDAGPEGLEPSQGHEPADALVWPEGEMELVLAGRYLDRFERRGGTWGIAHRRMVCDWCRTRPAADGWFLENPTAYRGRRHIEDSHLTVPASD